MRISVHVVQDVKRHWMSTESLVMKMQEPAMQKSSTVEHNAIVVFKKDPNISYRLQLDV